MFDPGYFCYLDNCKWHRKSALYWSLGRKLESRHSYENPPREGDPLELDADWNRRIPWAWRFPSDVILMNVIFAVLNRRNHANGKSVWDGRDEDDWVKFVGIRSIVPKDYSSGIRQQPRFRLTLRSQISAPVSFLRDISRKSHLGEFLGISSFQGASSTGMNDQIGGSNTIQPWFLNCTNTISFDRINSVNFCRGQKAFSVVPVRSRDVTFWSFYPSEDLNREWKAKDCWGQFVKAAMFGNLWRSQRGAKFLRSNEFLVDNCLKGATTIPALLRALEGSD